MKNYILLVVAFFAVSFAGSVSAQVARPLEAKDLGNGQTITVPKGTKAFRDMTNQERFESPYAAQLYDAAKASELVGKGDVEQAKRLVAAANQLPGESMIGYFMPTRNEIWQNENTQIYFKKVKNVGKVIFACRLLPAGQSGRFDESVKPRYINNPDFNYNAVMDTSFTDGDIYSIKTLDTGYWEYQGVHVFDCSIWTLDGLLLQQSFMDIYVEHRGPFDPMFEITSISNKQTTVISGRFPLGMDAWAYEGTMFGGARFVSSEIGIVQPDSTGTMIRFGGRSDYPFSKKVSLYLYFPQLRYVLMLRDGLRKQGTDSH